MKYLIVLFLLFFAVPAFAANATDLIVKFEGYSAKPYKDSKGQSIGYGHFIKSGEHYTSVTKAEALKLLAKDLKPITDYLNTLDLTDNQKAACASLAYNIGLGNFKKSTLVKKIKAGDSAAKEFLKWNKSDGETLTGLTARRKEEMKVFSK